jgi:hypothetical protein
MARTSLNLPPVLKEEAKAMASQPGVSLNQFIVWAVAEKIGGLKGRLDDPRFPHVTYPAGRSGARSATAAAGALEAEPLAIAEEQRLEPADAR